VEPTAEECYNFQVITSFALTQGGVVRALRRLVLFACFFATAQAALLADTAADERSLWELEHAYWRYVENNDLVAYSNLWHPDFLGWPFVSATPVHKDHITDWITSQTSKGFVFKTGELKPAALKVTGDVAFACYWISSAGWTNKERPHLIRCVLLMPGFGLARIGKLSEGCRCRSLSAGEPCICRNTDSPFR